MFINSQKIIICANRLLTKNLLHRCDYTKMLKDCSNVSRTQLHTTALYNYANTAALPIPNNIDADETTRFSPQRTRDISATVILSQHGQLAYIDITADNSLTSESNEVGGIGRDPHLDSYDCFGAVSLNSVMQSNVPSPFGGMHKFSHLNMPGGQWSQEYKFTSQNLHSSHYTNLRSNVRSGWMAYDQNATVQKKDQANAADWITLGKRYYSTKSDLDDNKSTSKTQSKKEQLKKAFKEYGSTVIVFHVTISLASLGACYSLVSGGIDVIPILEYLGFSSAALSNKVATGASTFVVAYAIHKVFAPVRISITLGATPFIVRYLRSKGFLKQQQK